MRLKGSALLAIVLLAGCAANPASLTKYGDVQLDGYNLIALTVHKVGTKPLGTLPGCVASVSRNDSINLSDSAGSFVGRTGTYYQASNNRQAGGGNVLQYVSPDESKVVATATTSYTGAMIERSVRFTMTIQATDQGRTYRFTGIQQAQLNTGSMANTGYGGVHIGAGGGSGHVLQSLNNLSSEIESCL